MISAQNNPRGFFLAAPSHQSNLVKRYPNPPKSQIKKVKKKKVKNGTKTKNISPGFPKKSNKLPNVLKSGGSVQPKGPKAAKVQPLASLRPLPVPQISRSLQIWQKAGGDIDLGQNRISDMNPYPIGSPEASMHSSYLMDGSLFNSNAPEQYISSLRS